MISKQLIRSVVLILFISSQALAQKPPAQTTSEEQTKAERELQRKALDLLDDVIKDGDTFKHAENRIHIKAIAANILWKYDEARARILFKDAMASFADLLNNPPADDDTPPEVRRGFEGTRMLRVELLGMLAQRDARLAREFMRSTTARTTQPGADGNLMQDADFQMDMGLAGQIASSDPKLALEIAEEGLARGFPYQLPQIIAAMQEKDPETAAKLASEIVSKLSAEKLASTSDARQAAIDVLGLAVAEPRRDAKGSTKPSTPLLDQATLRQLTEMIAAEALRAPAQNSNILYALRSIMPAIEKYAPARAAQLKQKMPRTVPDEVDEDGAEDEAANVPDFEKYRGVLEKGSTEDLIEAAARAQPPLSYALYQAAASRMIESGDTEHARQLINEKIKDEGQRKQLLEQLDKASAATAVEQGKIDQARKMLAALRTNEERVNLLAQFALGAAAKGDKKVALKLLDEASGMLGQRAKNINQLGAQLMVAHAYAQLDPSRSLTILEPIVDQLNELLGAAAILGGFFAEEIVRDDEVMIGPITAFLGFANGDFVQYLGDLSLLARADFERTKALVGKFQRDEVRTIMRLFLAQSILAPLPSNDIRALVTGERASFRIKKIPSEEIVVTDKEVP